MRTTSSFAPLRALSRLRLRTSLVLLLVIGVAVMALDRGREANRTRDRAVERASLDVQEAARSGADRQADLLAQARAIVQMAAELPATAPSAGSACHEPFKQTVAKLPWLRGMAVIGTDGIPICTSSDQPSRRSVADRPHFQEALRTGEPVLSDFVIGRLTGEPTIVLVQPRKREGRLESLIFASIDLQWLNRLAAETGAAFQARVLLADGNGTVLAAYPDPGKWTGRNLADNANLFKRLKSDGDSRLPETLDGEAQIVGHARLPETDAVLAVMVPYAEVIANANAEARYAVFKIGIAGLIALLSIWLGGELLVLGPLRTLGESAAKLGSGHLAERIATEGLAPELKRLADSFNAMAVQLHDRETDLRRTNELLLDLASKDGLTGIANRRAFDERIAAEWNRAGRDSRPLSLLTIDVDYFKKFNDRYGHLVGDACLREVAKTLSLSARRGGDLVARIGGEEFAVLLPNLDLEGAGRIAEALRERIEQLGVEHCESPLRIVTVSVGVAAARPVKGASFNALIDWADSALYEAKRAGRNRVVLDRPKISLAS